ncbi:MAG: hydrolase [Salibacteraceae bacterium]|nr:hydrolase [Salibacteraceae bacterium]
MVIAVDFDGTIVEDCYPEIGEPKIFSFETLREIQKNNHQLILWTNRTGESLKEAVVFCKQNGVEFYAVNASYPEEKFENTASRKINCEVFISEKNIGGMPGWGEAWQEIREMTGQGIQENDQFGKPSIIERIISIFK